MPTAENFGAGKSPRLATKPVDCIDDPGIDFTRQDPLHDFDRGRVGHALPFDKPCLQTRRLERARDRLASTVHHHRIDPNRL